MLRDGDDGPADAPPVAVVAQTSPVISQASPGATIAEDPETQSPKRAEDPTVLSLVRKGDRFLELGDLASARLLYRAASERGSAAAAARIGKTFDPIYFQRSGVRGARAALAEAVEWYRKAIEMGDETDSRQRLERLLSHLRTAADAGDAEARDVLEAVAE